MEKVSEVLKRGKRANSPATQANNDDMETIASAQHTGYF